MSLSTVRILAEGDHVHVVKDGRLVFDLPWDAALQLARAIHQKAKQAEEYAKRDVIVYDQAILARRGFRWLGLTDHPVLQKMAMHTAVWDRNLRRYLPGGIKSQAAVGTPTVLNRPPREKESQT